MWARSGLGRPFDFHLTSNRFGVAVPVAAGIVAGAWALIAGTGASDAVRVGVSAGGASFLAWALGRELDPDHPASAGISALAAPWLVLVANPALAQGFLLLLAIRSVAGTTGAAPYPADVIVVSALAVWVGAGERGLIAAVFGLLVFAGYAPFDARGRRRTLVLGGAGLGVAVLVSILLGEAQGPAIARSSAAWWLGAITVITTAAVFVRTSAQTDRRPEPVSAARVRIGVPSAGVFVMLVTAWQGPTGVAIAGPVMVALSATSLSVAFGGVRGAVRR